MKNPQIYQFENRKTPPINSILNYSVICLGTLYLLLAKFFVKLPSFAIDLSSNYQAYEALINTLFSLSIIVLIFSITSLYFDINNFKDNNQIFSETFFVKLFILLISTSFLLESSPAYSNSFSAYFYEAKQIFYQLMYAFMSIISITSFLLVLFLFTKRFDFISKSKLINKLETIIVASLAVDFFTCFQSSIIVSNYYFVSNILTKVLLFLLISLIQLSNNLSKKKDDLIDISLINKSIFTILPLISAPSAFYVIFLSFNKLEPYAMLTFIVYLIIYILNIFSMFYSKSERKEEDFSYIFIYLLAFTLFTIVYVTNKEYVYGDEKNNVFMIYFVVELINSCLLTVFIVVYYHFNFSKFDKEKHQTLLILALVVQLCKISFNATDFISYSNNIYLSLLTIFSSINLILLAIIFFIENKKNPIKIKTKPKEPLVL